MTIWGSDVDLGIRFQNSGDSVVDQGMPEGKNDWGHDGEGFRVW
jgi:hypothetical protein